MTQTHRAERNPHTGAWSLAMGATVAGGGVTFRVWAPDAARMDVALDSGDCPMRRDGDATWSAHVPGIGAGARYRYRIGGGDAFPDPCSRYQPEGPHAQSEVVDPAAHAWHDGDWPGLRRDGLVIYECHVGTHTPEGTFDALAGDLDALRQLGVNAIELMPVADFPGARNWGYDGVNLYAPSRNYGGPEGLRRLVDAAHAHGIGVILDVVYNHFGPDGNYLLEYAREYLTDRHKTPWGDAVNYDGPRSEHVRRYIIDNARYWITEYHIDGLRFDATFAIIDESPRHVLADLTDAVRLTATRPVVLIAETHENDTRYLEPTSEGGLGFDAVWCDDFHHVVHTAASHEHSGYYADYAGTTAELARTVNRGWLFEGQPSKHLGDVRGTSADGVEAAAFVYFIQNHDQVGNRAFGRRFAHLVGVAAQRRWAALLLLLPYTPMIFAGQEFAASSRFYYFTDHKEELGRQVTEGRREEFARFQEFADPRQQREIPDPQSSETFLASKLQLQERREGVGEQIFRLYADLIALRRSDAVVSRQDRGAMHAMAASEDLLLVRMWHGREQRLLVVNSGVGIDAAPDVAGVPDDIARMPWRLVFSTEERRYGGSDDLVRFDEGLIALPPYSAVFLATTTPPLPARAMGAGRRLLERMRRVS